MHPMTILQEMPYPQTVPVKIYATAERITIAAPMPGMEPENISVDVTSQGLVVLQGRLRGALKGEKTLLYNEWSVGPYYRTVPLPCPVDGVLANVTYGNGVLVVVLPVASALRPAHLTLQEISATVGKRAGSAGTPIRPRSTAESGNRRRA